MNLRLQLKQQLVITPQLPLESTLHVKMRVASGANDMRASFSSLDGHSACGAPTKSANLVINGKADNTHAA